MLGLGLVFTVFRFRVGLGFGALGHGVGPEPNKVWSGFGLWGVESVQVFLAKPCGIPLCRV